MIILLIEILSTFILAMILSTVIFDERKKRSQDMRRVKLKGYWSGPNRRSEERLSAFLDVKYAVNGKSSNTRSVDISAKGIRLLLDEKFEKGTPLRLEIKLPGQNRIVKSYGEVAWTEESQEDKKTSAKRLFNTGIKLFKFQERGEKELFDFIHQLQSQKR